MAQDQLERIRHRAYALWEQQGRPQGVADAHWHQARAEIVGEATPAPRKKAAAAKATTTTTKRSVPAQPKPRA